MSDPETALTRALRRVAEDAPTMAEFGIPAPSPSHTRGRGLLAAAAALVAILIPAALLAGPWHDRTPRTPAATSTIPATPTPTPTSTGGATCRATDLTGVVQVTPAGMNTVYNYVLLTNTGEPCLLRGVPRVVAVSDSGRRTEVSAATMQTVPYDTAAADLDHGRTAVVLITAHVAGCNPQSLQTRPVYRSVELSFPDGPSNVRAEVTTHAIEPGLGDRLAIGCQMEISDVSLQTW